MMESRLALRELGNIAEMSSGRPRTKTSQLNNNGGMMRPDFSTHEITRLPTDVDSNPQISNDTSQYEKEEREMFSNLEKPRVRYDVEVITKLIVYSGKI